MDENTTTTTEEDSVGYDATNEEEDPSNLADIEWVVNGDKEVDPDATSSTVPQDDIELPSNDFCFIEDDFLQSVTGMNESTKRLDTPSFHDCRSN